MIAMLIQFLLGTLAIVAMLAALVAGVFLIGALAYFITRFICEKAGW